MNTQDGLYARAQANALDNIAPTTLQGLEATKYAQNDNYLSSEEASAVLRRQIEANHPEIERKLSQIGVTPEWLQQNPQLEKALYSGQQTTPVGIWLHDNLQMYGKLRIVMTDNGPDIRITPTQRELTIPNEVQGVRLSKDEQQQLATNGAIQRPFMLPENGQYVPSYLRVDRETNTVELWRVRPEQMPTKLFGIDLTREQQLQLASGYPVHLSGLRDSQGEAFNATVSVSASKQALEFSNLSRLDATLKPDTDSRQQLALNNEGAKTDKLQHQETVTGQRATSHAQAAEIKAFQEAKPESADTTTKMRQR